MARSRNIKPSFFQNELLGTSDPYVGLLFISLWTIADKSGRLEDRPLRIKASTFPYREGVNIEQLLTQLVSLGFIERYEVDGLKIIQVMKFEKHQSPHSTEKASELPPKPLNYKHTAEVTLKVESASVNANINVLIPDSLNTDSLIPDSNTLSGEKSPDHSASIQAQEILAYLNEKSGRAFKAVRSNLNLIDSRLKNFTVEELKSVVDKKCEEWLDDPAMSAYVRPETLFNATKCASYVATPLMGKRRAQVGNQSKHQSREERNAQAWDDFLNESPPPGSEKIIEGEVIRD
jgi:uncharacterized phage protein (TIGR02220 family)